MTERPLVTPEEVLERVAAAGGHLVLTDLDIDELAAWRHAARVAQLRLWRTGSARLRKWTSGTSLRITVTDPSAPAETLRREGHRQTTAAGRRRIRPPPGLHRPGCPGAVEGAG